MNYIKRPNQSAGSVAAIVPIVIVIIIGVIALIAFRSGGNESNNSNGNGEEETSEVTTIIQDDGKTGGSSNTDTTTASNTSLENCDDVITKAQIENIYGRAIVVVSEETFSSGGRTVTRCKYHTDDPARTNKLELEISDFSKASESIKKLMASTIQNGQLVSGIDDAYLNANKGGALFFGDTLITVRDINVSDQTNSDTRYMNQFLQTISKNVR